MVATQLRHRAAAEARHSAEAAVQGAGQAMKLAALDYVERRAMPTQAKAAVACGACGILGACSMLAGDVLLYGPEAYGHPASAYFAQVDPSGTASTAAGLADSPMGATPRGRAIQGGLLGPLAAMLYIAGCFQFLLAAIPMQPVPHARSGVDAHGFRFRWAPEGAVWRAKLLTGLLAFFGHAAVFTVVAVYHAQFAYTAFIASAELTAGQMTLLEAHMAYMASLKLMVKVFGILGTCGLAGICWTDATPMFPRWLLALNPTLWLFAVRESGLLALLPAPLGLILAGGSFNLAFLAFFVATTLQAEAFRRQLRAD